MLVRIQKDIMVNGVSIVGENELGCSSPGPETLVLLPKDLQMLAENVDMFSGTLAIGLPFAVVCCALCQGQKNREIVDLTKGNWENLRAEHKWLEGACAKFEKCRNRLNLG